MGTQFAAFVFFLFLSLPAWAGLRVFSFTLTPSTIYAASDQEVLFSVKTEKDGEGGPSALEVLQIVDGKIKYRWPLKDDGFYGDERAGDGICSRTAFFNEKIPGELVFVVSFHEHDRDINWNQAPVSSQARLRVLPVPSFLETLEAVWRKLKY